MSWALKGLSGPLENKTTSLTEGLTLGRRGDIVILDTKASTVHARIVQSSAGQWLLTDNESKNGVRVDGERVAVVALIPGVIFYIGDQGFEVIDLASKKAEPTDLKIAGGRATRPERPTGTERPPPPPGASAVRPVKTRSAKSLAARTSDVPKSNRQRERPPISTSALIPTPTSTPAALRVSTPEPTVVKRMRYWHELLSEFLSIHKKSFTERKKPVAPLNPALVLDFVRGLQANSRWIVGYGPRKIGASSLDLPIWEPGAPAVCFEVSPSPDGILFRTSQPAIVQLNGQQVDSQVLRVGDTIRILETIIEVDFTE